MARSDDEDFRALYEQIQTLTERVDSMEDELNTVSKKKATKNRVLQLEKDLTDLSERLDETVEILNDVEDRLDELDSVDDELTGIKRRVSDHRDELTEKIRETNRRIASVEDAIDHEPDQSSELQIPEDASEIEYLAALPEDIREKHIDSVPLRRAVRVYEYFDRWSEYTPNGYIIKSGDLKRFLSDEDLSYSQIYRVMEAFGKHTDADYAYVERDTTGKILIHFHDD